MTTRLIFTSCLLVAGLASAVYGQSSEPVTGQHAQQAPELPGPSSPGTPPPHLTPGGQQPPEATQPDETLLPGAGNGAVITDGTGLLSTNDIIGLEVWSAGNRNVGTVSELLIDADGRLAAVVVDIGGFLGIGSRQVAIPFAALTVVPEGDGSDAPAEGTPQWWPPQGANHLRAELTEQQFEDAPEFNRAPLP
ncbi:PRC-barrel domain-containing protein [Pelagibacterium limicola]|uniref:PRC-barrel domain-containing protein n=1 Tax=Pelagibacterium limicola TaxID=2791022 RepID=UPI0018AFB463|nr:PRC-barrel domain-containing protein [Pelagibacterium limicola]